LACCPTAFRLDPDRLAFIDETWATTNTRYGRAPRGQRLVAAATWALEYLYLRCQLEHQRPHHAILVVDGAMNGDIFRAYVEQVLAPRLKPGDIRHPGQSRQS
jgi:hypothetical protein